MRKGPQHGTHQGAAGASSNNATIDSTTLSAGTTGSGKSVLIQVVLLDIAATNPSTLAKIILIDPKMGVDYTALDRLPHLREPIVVGKERLRDRLGCRELKEVVVADG